jgi:hypothetical protein
MRRPVWLALGVGVGVGGTLWAEQKVRRVVRQTAERLTPEHAARQARQRVSGLGERFKTAVEEGRDERSRREAELWAELSGPPRGTVRLHPVDPPSHQRRRGSVRPHR